MRRLRLLTALAWIAVALLFSHFSGEVGRVAPQRRPQLELGPEPRPEPRAESGAESGAFRPLPEASRRDPEFRVKGAACQSTCTGTAFSLSRDGLWMTARHVVDHCRRIFLLGRDAVPVTGLFLHPAADVALLRTAGGPEALALGERTLGIGQDGFGFGFPAGRPGEVYGQLLGRTKVRAVADGSVAPGIVWAEVARNPDSLPQLGGLSGSPMLDRSGEVIGVLIASSDRRGRVVSAAPVSLRQALGQAGATAHAPARPAPPVEPRDFVAYGDALRSSLKVAKVACDARGLGSRRPAPSF